MASTTSGKTHTFSGRNGAVEAPMSVPSGELNKSGSFKLAEMYVQPILPILLVLVCCDVSPFVRLVHLVLIVLLIIVVLVLLLALLVLFVCLFCFFWRFFFEIIWPSVTCRESFSWAFHGVRVSVWWQWQILHLIKTEGLEATVFESTSCTVES